MQPSITTFFAACSSIAFGQPVPAVWQIPLVGNSDPRILGNEFDKIRKERETKRAYLEELDQKLTVKAAELNQLKGATAESKRKSDAILSEENALTQAFDEQEQQVKDAHLRKEAQLKAEILKLQEALDLKRKDKDVSAQKEDITRLSSQKNDLLTQNAEMGAKLQELSAAVDTMNALDQQNKEMEVEMQKQDGKYDEVKNEITRLDTEVRSLNEQILYFTSVKQDTYLKIPKLKEENLRFNKKIAIANSEKQNLEDTLKELSESNPEGPLQGWNEQELPR